MTRVQPMQPLTTRELHVTERVAVGLSAKQISADLQLSVRTVEHYIESAAAKVPGPPGSPRGRLMLWWHGVAA